MTIFDVLRRETQESLRLLRELTEGLRLTDGLRPGAAARERVLEQVRVQIESLNRVEEALLYPLLVNDPRTYARTLASVQENREIEDLLDDLLRLPPRDERHDLLVELLSERFSQHAEREEHELLAEAEQRVPRERAEPLGRHAVHRKLELEVELRA